MKLLVLGGTGLVGQAITADAKSRSYDVVTAARTGADIHLDVSIDRSLEDVVSSVAPDIIINCAALASIDACEEDPRLAYRVNAQPLAVLAGWSRSENRPFVQVSTDHFFIEGGSRKHSEQEPVTLVNEYARTKHAGEDFALTAPLALVLRTNIVGIRGWKAPTFAEWAISCIEQGEPMTLFEDTFVSSIDVRAFARAALDLVEHGASGLLNLASREVFTKGEFIRALAQSLGKPLIEPKSGSVKDLQPPRASSLGLDVTAAEQRLGYRLPDMQTVAASVVGQYRDRQHA